MKLHIKTRKTILSAIEELSTSDRRHNVKQELTQKAGIARSASARLEYLDSKPRTSTLKKLVSTIKISIEQLSRLSNPLLLIWLFES